MLVVRVGSAATASYGVGVAQPVFVEEYDSTQSGQMPITTTALSTSACTLATGKTNFYWYDTEGFPSLSSNGLLVSQRVIAEGHLPTAARAPLPTVARLLRPFAPTAGAGGPAVGAPTGVQYAVYSPTPFTAGNDAQVTASGFPVAGIIAIAVGVVALAGGVFAYIRYVRYSAGGRELQYATMDVSGAMNTISVPAPVAAARTGATSTGGGGGFMASLRSMLTAPMTGGGGYGRAPLADSDYSALEDRASAYM